MASFLEKCEDYFDSQDFYEILKIKRDATEKQIKKAYHKLSLLIHPDRVDEQHKTLATEKFKVLGKIHEILHDVDKRKIYDETGNFDEDDGDASFNWMNYWNAMFKPITKKDIEDYEKEYLGSETELRDIKKAYVGTKGNMTKMLEQIPFSDCDKEKRYIDIVRQMIDDGEVEEYDGFFNEPKRKKDRRWKKWQEEREEVNKMKVNDSDLEKQILENHNRRAQQFSNLLNKLEGLAKSDTKKRAAITGTAKPSKRTRSSAKK